MEKLIAGTIASVATALVLFGVGITGIGDSDTETPNGVHTSAPGITAADICGWDETAIKRVTAESGDKFFVAKYENADVRYDLTWRDGSPIAIEQLAGANYDLWTEQRSSAFDRCLTTKTIVDVVEGH